MSYTIRWEYWSKFNWAGSSQRHWNDLMPNNTKRKLSLVARKQTWKRIHIVLYNIYFLWRRQRSDLKIARRALEHYTRYDFSPRGFGQLLVQIVLVIFWPFHIVCDMIVIFFHPCPGVRPTRHCTTAGIFRRKLYSSTV